MSNLGKIAKVVLPMAVPGALGLMSVTVFAASEAKENNTTLMTDELSLNDTLESPPLRYEEPELGHVEQGVASLRKTVEPYVSWCQEKTQFAMEKVQSYYKTVEPGVNTTQSIVKDMYAFLNDPPSEFFPSVGVIGFSGILGLFLAKGSRVKRLMFHWADGSEHFHVLPTACRLCRQGKFTVLSVQMDRVCCCFSAGRPVQTATTKHYIFSWGSEGQVVLEELLRGKSSSKEKVEKTQKTDSQKSS